MQFQAALEAAGHQGVVFDDQDVHGQIRSGAGSGRV